MTDTSHLTTEPPAGPPADNPDSGSIPDSSDTSQDLPARIPKTHCNDTIIAFLKNLSRTRKLLLNEDISKRNETRDIKQDLQAADPIAYPANISNNSSLVTVSEPDISTPPSSPSESFLSRFTPSTRNIFNKLFQKRTLDHGLDDLEPPSKRQHRDITLETKILPGSVTTYGFHKLHYDLDIYKCYLPLSLFTNESLHTILHEANSLPLKKINPANHKSKPPLVLDINLFEKKFGREDTLSHPPGPRPRVTTCASRPKPVRMVWKVLGPNIGMHTLASLIRDQISSHHSLPPLIWTSR
jgi:hypothetical protein